MLWPSCVRLTSSSAAMALAMAIIVAFPQYDLAVLARHLEWTALTSKF
jgi:hypothetical protein